MNPMIYRVDDAGQIKSYEESAQGYLTCFMTFSKVGDLLYRREDGRVEVEHVPPEELFDPVSLASAAHKPIVKNHPTESINSTNIRKFLRGTTSSKVIVDAPFVTIVGVIHDQGLIDDVRSGRLKEVSAGYFTHVKKDDSGRLIQTARRYDHFALVERGRAGSQVKIHYDSPDTDLSVGSSDSHVIMTPVRCDGPFTHLQQQHMDSTPKWQRPLSLSRQIPPEQLLGVPKHQQPLRLTKKSVGRVMDKIGGGPFDHLKRQP